VESLAYFVCVLISIANRSETNLDASVAACLIFGPGPEINQPAGGTIMRIETKTALVTGGAHRVGKAITLALARAGANVAVHYHTSSRL
jgi:hypothetical protein